MSLFFWPHFDSSRIAIRLACVTEGVTGFSALFDLRPPLATRFRPRGIAYELQRFTKHITLVVVAFLEQLTCAIIAIALATAETRNRIKMFYFIN